MIYLGPPGTGKTHKLLELLEIELTRGIPIERLAFLTFTRRAKREAVERVEKVLGIKARDLPHFRTIHSLAFRALGLKEGDVLAKKQLDEFGTHMGLTFGGSALTETASEGINSQAAGDQMMALDNLCRLRGETLKKTWNGARSNVDWHTVEHFSSSYRLYKKEKGLLDFTDVLQEFARAGLRLEVDAAFIDEAQDLSALQWYAALQAVEGALRQYVAGDDDQALYRWSGADVQYFMNLAGERRVLSQSYRLPRSVHKLASSIIHRVKDRIVKPFSPRDAEGEVRYHPSVESLPRLGDGQWLWLVRNRYLLSGLRNTLQQQGIVFSSHGYSSINAKERDAIYDWERLRAGKSLAVHRIRDVYSHLKSKTQLKHGFKLLPNIDEDAQLLMVDLVENYGLLATGTWFDVFTSIPDERRAYYRALLRAKKTLKLDPQVQLETIHGAKGAEADNVVVFTEQSRRVWDEAQFDPLMADDEHRVFYVSVTRAKESLHIISPGARWGYMMPKVEGK